MPELWSELAERYRALGRFDAAVEAVWAALDAGWNGAPDGRCDIARYLVQAGRPMQADAVYAAVRVDTPEDTWLYNAAGIEWSFAHDPLRALTWLTEGIELAIAGADPNGIVAQMSEERRRCLTALGSHLDDLEHRVDTFLETGNAAKRYRPGHRGTKTRSHRPTPARLPVDPRTRLAGRPASVAPPRKRPRQLRRLPPQPATRVPQRQSLRPLDDQGRSAGTGPLPILVRRTRTPPRSAHLTIALRRRPRPDRRRGHLAARTRRPLLVRLPRHLRPMLCPRISAARRGHPRPATDPGVLNDAFARREP